MAISGQDRFTLFTRAMKKHGVMRIIQSGMSTRQVKTRNNMLLSGVVKHNCVVVYGCQATV